MDTDQVMSVLDRGEAVAKQLMESLQNLATEYGPDAYNFLLLKIRIDAIQEITYACVIALCLVVAIWFQIKILPVYEDTPDNPLDLFKGTVAPISLLIAGFLFFLETMPSLLNLWNWIAIFNPELRLARDIIEKVLG